MYFTGHVIEDEVIRPYLPSLSTKRGYAGRRKHTMSAGSIEGSTDKDSKANDVEEKLIGRCMGA